MTNIPTLFLEALRVEFEQLDTVATGGALLVGIGMVIGFFFIINIAMQLISIAGMVTTGVDPIARTASEYAMGDESDFTDDEIASAYEDEEEYIGDDTADEEDGDDD